MAMQVVELMHELHPAQAAIYNSGARFKVVAAGRGFGKSYYAALILIQEAMRTTNDYGFALTPDHGVYYVAPTFDQAKRAIWQKILMLAGGMAEQGGLIRNLHTNDGWFELVSGRRIYVKGADDPERLRGIRLSYAVLDEFADMKPQTWTEILEPALMNVKGGSLFIGTPKGKNHFYKMFMAAADDGKLWEAFHFKSSDNPFIPPDEYERMMNDPHKSRDLKRQELEASFISGGANILRADNFPIVDVAPSYSLGRLYTTVDLAGFVKSKGRRYERRDDSCVATTLVIQDEWHVLDMKYGQWDPRETALNILTAVRKYPGTQLGIEAGALSNAVQPYLDDYMRQYNRYVTANPLKHGNASKVDRIVWALQGRSEKHKIKLVKGPWNNWFLDQCADFPDPLSHDDGPDALAYVDQLSHAIYADPADVQDWQPMDLTAGY